MTQQQLTWWTIFVIVTAVVIAIRLRPASITDAFSSVSGMGLAIFMITMGIVIGGPWLYYTVRAQSAKNINGVVNDMANATGSTGAQNGGGAPAPNTGGGPPVVNPDGTMWYNGKLIQLPNYNGGVAAENGSTAWTQTQPAPTTQPAQPAVEPTPIPPPPTPTAQEIADAQALELYYSQLEPARLSGDRAGGMAAAEGILAITPYDVTATQVKDEILAAEARVVERDRIINYGEGQTQEVITALGPQTYQVRKVTDWKFDMSNPFYFPTKWEEVSIIVDITPGWNYGDHIRLLRGHISDIVTDDKSEDVGAVFEIAGY